MVTSKIEYQFFYLDFLLYKAKKHYFRVAEMTRKTRNTELISYFEYA